MIHLRDRFMLIQTPIRVHIFAFLLMLNLINKFERAHHHYAA